jgi:hypothetical protein
MYLDATPGVIDPFHPKIVGNTRCVGMRGNTKGPRQEEERRVVVNQRNGGWFLGSGFLNTSRSEKKNPLEKAWDANQACSLGLRHMMLCSWGKGAPELEHFSLSSRL